MDSISSCPPAGASKITIDWGDGSAPSGGRAFEAGSGCDISGSHTYAEEGSYITKVSYPSPNGATSTDAGAASVTDAPVMNSAVSAFTLSAGAQLGAVVSNWSDPAPEALSRYGATIDWGDGQSSTGSIANGTVSGTHTYVNGGRFTITVTLQDEGGASATVHEQAIVSGCPSSAASTPGPLFVPTGTGLNARLVQALYHDVLGRDPSPAEVSYAVNALSLGLTRSQLVLTLLDSVEYRTRLIASDFAAYLHRAPTVADTNAFLGLLGSGASDEALIAQILGSPEYLATRGNNSTDGFLSAMYCDTLFRSIDQFAQNSDDSALGIGTPRTAIASALLGSTEYLSRLVYGFYLHYLRRAAASSELATWAALIHSGGTDESVIASILSSPEYFDRFNPAVALATALSVNGRTIGTTLSRSARLTLTVFRILPLGHADVVKAGPPHARLVGVVDFGLHRKGRVKLHWNGRVHRKRLAKGPYLLVLKAYRGHDLIGISDALSFRVR